MTNAVGPHRRNLKDTTDLYNDIANNGYLPAVSIVKPSGLVDGHPASSKLDLFEGFTKKIIDLIRAQPDLWKDTAIFVTFDEGRRLLRLRLRAAGRLLRRRHAHPSDRRLAARHRRTHRRTSTATTCPSLQIHRAQLGPGAASPRRSRDNLPNPTVTKKNPYVPTNAPALSDLWGAFDFGQ